MGWKIIILVFLIIILLIPLKLTEASSTIKGKVQYWNTINKQYEPVKNVHINVTVLKTHFSGNLTSKYDLHSDYNGNYEIFSKDDINKKDTSVKIKIWAETKDRISIYENSLEYNRYNALHNVSLPNTVNTHVVDIFISGGSLSSQPDNDNIDEWGEEENAVIAAFLIHQELLKHSDALSKWTNTPSIDVIVPAIGGATLTCGLFLDNNTAYYNHVSDNINLGVGDQAFGSDWWNYLDIKYVDDLINHQSMLVTIGHEYGHAVHDEIATFVPIGLGKPSIHYFDRESDQFLAYTEGFAHFLPLALMNVENALEPTLCVTSSSTPQYLTDLSHTAWKRKSKKWGISFPANSKHDYIEGEVAALLWDLYDQPMFEDVGEDIEYTRHSVRQMNDGTQVHSDLWPQEWIDRIEDPNFYKIKQAVQGFEFTGYPLDLLKEKRDALAKTAQRGTSSINGFLIEYFLRLRESEYHDFKTVMFNRDILPKELELRENPCRIIGPLKVSRIGNDLSLVFTIHERDTEDRPAIRIDVWNQINSTAGLLQIHKGKTGEFESNWQGTQKEISIGPMRLSPAPLSSGKIWIVVNDDMLPYIYKIDMPSRNTENLLLPGKGFVASITDQSRSTPVNTLIVAKDGTEFNQQGTKKHPFLSISKAIEKAYPEDIILIRSGNYPELISISKPLTLKAVDNEIISIGK